jgi:hypothetical protein
MTQEHSDVPVACRLPDAELRKREATLIAQFRSSVMAIEELPNGYAFCIPGDKKSIEIAEGLIAAERECCPFLTFEFIAHPNRKAVSVRVTGPSGTKEFLKEIFAIPASASR